MDPFDPRRAALLTDLYEITMAAAYWEHGLSPRATFELSFRTLPPGRGYVVAAGLEPAALYLLDLQFHEDQIRFLRNLFTFHNVRPEFWDWLGKLRFTGDLWAVPEGTPVFPDEPILRVTAPLAEAQLVETYLLATVAYSSTVASKAARLVQAAGGKPVVDFGARRAHGPVAGVLAARAAYIAGAAGTSSVEAGMRLGVPVHGTMAHSFVQAFASEREAFKAYHQVFADSATFLLDTYDTRRAAEIVADLKLPLRSVRIDSGDLQELSRAVRQTLDEAGMNGVKIVASGDLDEEKIAALVAAGAPIDSFGVGTQLAVSPDSPVLQATYKLVEIERDGVATPRLKTSPDKASLPGTKQVWRRFSSERRATGDVIGLAGEQMPGAPLLLPVLEGGRASIGRPGLETSRDHARAMLASLPDAVKHLDHPEPYPVALSDTLAALRDRLRDEAHAPGAAR